MEKGEDGKGAKPQVAEPPHPPKKVPVESPGIQGDAKKKPSSSSITSTTTGSGSKTSGSSGTTTTTSTGSSTTSPLEKITGPLPEPYQDYNVVEDEIFRTNTEANDDWKKERFYSDPSDFVFLLFALTIGCSAIWRFPFLLYKYGGGFLLAYMIFLFFVGYPLFFVELSLGQFHSAGVLKLYRNLVPIFRGIGIAKLFIIVLVVTSSSSMFSLCLFYMGSTVTMHWGQCHSAPVDRTWNNSLHCYSMLHQRACVGIPSNQNARKWLYKGVCYNNRNIDKVLNMIDDCVETTHKDSKTMWTVHGQKNHSNCSFGLKFDFKNKGDVKQILFGQQSKVETHYSLCMVKKYQNRGDCLFKKDTGCGTRDDLGSIKNVVGQRILDMRFRNPTKYLNSDTVMRRGEQIRSLLESSYRRNLSDIIRAYCESEELIICLKKLVVPDESFSGEEFAQQVFDKPYDAYTNHSAVWYHPVLVALCIGCFLVGVVDLGGRYSISTLIYPTTIPPIIVTLALVFLSVTLGGSQHGIDTLFTMRLCELRNYELWLEAFGQAIASLAVGTGILEHLASYNPFHHNLLGASMLVAFANTAFSLIFSIGVFGIIGTLAETTGRPIEDLMRGGTTGVSFATFVDASAGLDQDPNTVMFLYFGMLALLSFNVAVLGYDAFASALVAQWPILDGHRLPLNSWLSLGLFFLGIPLVSQKGQLYLRVLDNITHDWCIGVGLLLSLVALCRYGIANYVEDISMMSQQEEEGGQPKEKVERSKGKLYFMATLLGLISFLLLTYLAASWWFHYINIPEPMLGIIIGVPVIVFGLCVCVIVGIFLELHSHGFDFRDVFIPRPQAGPVINADREGRYPKLEELKINDEPPYEYFPYTEEDMEYLGGGWPIPDPHYFLETGANSVPERKSAGNGGNRVNARKLPRPNKPVLGQKPQKKKPMQKTAPKSKKE